MTQPGEIEITKANTAKERTRPIIELETLEAELERMRLTNKILEGQLADIKKAETSRRDLQPTPQKCLISFESGHYKEVTGRWKGDRIWTHFKKASGGEVHINKDKVEYMETFD